MGWAKIFGSFSLSFKAVGSDNVSVPQPASNTSVAGIDGDFNITHLQTDLLITVVVIVAGILIGLYLLTSLRTKQKRDAEAFLSSILHTTLSGIISFRAIRKKETITDFRITFVNAPIQEFLGMTEAELMNKTMRDINPLVEEEGYFEKYVRVTETGEAHKFERRIGEQFFDVLIAKFNDGFIASYYNITDLKGTERKLNQKIQELENINVELEQFAYVTSHDLQEPLRKINMFADLMQQSCTEKENLSHLSSIVRNTVRMRKLILKLSEYSKLKTNNTLFRMVDLNEVIKDLLLIYEDLMVQCNTSLSCTQLPMVYGIPLQLYTLFDNLINNAIKFSKIDSPCIIDISLRKPDPMCILKNENLNAQLQYVEIVFRDNGLGFDQAYAGKIFQVFQTLDRTASGEDVGIGLALCLKIVRGHQGDIFAVSNVSEGSEFHILLPVQTLDRHSAEPSIYLAEK